MASTVRTRSAISRRYLEGRFDANQIAGLAKSAYRVIRSDHADRLGTSSASWSYASACRDVVQHRVAISADHAGWKAARLTKAILEALQVQSVRDFGPDKALLRAVPELDYPTMITPAIETLGAGDCSRVILCTGRGADAAIHAGKIGYTAVKAVRPEDAIFGRQREDAKVLTFGEELIADGVMAPAEMACSIVLFLSVPLAENGGRVMQQTAAIRRLVQANERVPEREVVWETSPQFSSVVDPSRELEEELSREPSLADILFVKAREALLKGEGELAKHLIERYIREGDQRGNKSPNYEPFLTYFASLLKAGSSMREVDVIEVQEKIRIAVA